MQSKHILSYSSWKSYKNRINFESQESDDLSFDFIVCHYQENIDLVAALLRRFRALGALQKYSRVRVFVYTKDELASLSKLQKALDTPNVIQLPNRGREAGTYLHHIVKHWNDLATHNLFMQAGLHEEDDAMNRLDDYLAPNTGVLSLGTHELCSCIDCKDPWNNIHSFPRLQELYAIVNRQFCPERLALSYLGQIIASRRRIKSRPLELYLYIKDVLESELSHTIHSDPRNFFEDSVANPYFGHTMERAYGILWGCDNPDIVEKCGSNFPGLGARRGPTDRPDKCQCLD
jgi:Protein of unknown function (DUF3431)